MKVASPLDSLSPLQRMRLVFYSIVGMLVIFLIFDGIVVVDAGEVGVVFDRVKGVLDKPLPAGINLKMPLLQAVDRYNVRTQAYTMNKAEDSEGDVQARSRDGQVVTMEATVLFHVNPADAPTIKKTLGSEANYYQAVIRAKSRSLLREVVARYDALDMVSDKRVEIVNEMNKALMTSFAENHITLEEVVLRDVNFSSEFAAAIEEKQIGFQKVKTAEYQKQQAEQLKEKQIIEAQGEAEAIRLKGEMLKANPNVIQFEFVQKMAPDIKWGILPSGATPLINVNDLNQ